MSSSPSKVQDGDDSDAAHSIPTRGVWAVGGGIEGESAAAVVERSSSLLSSRNENNQINTTTVNTGSRNNSYLTTTTATLSKNHSNINNNTTNTNANTNNNNNNNNTNDGPSSSNHNKSQKKKSRTRSHNKKEESLAEERARVEKAMRQLEAAKAKAHAQRESYANYLEWKVEMQRQGRKQQEKEEQRLRTRVNERLQAVLTEHKALRRAELTVYRQYANCTAADVRNNLTLNNQREGAQPQREEGEGADDKLLNSSFHRRQRLSEENEKGTNNTNNNKSTHLVLADSYGEEDQHFASYLAEKDRKAQEWELTKRTIRQRVGSRNNKRRNDEEDGGREGDEYAAKTKGKENGGGDSTLLDLHKPQRPRVVAGVEIATAGRSPRKNNTNNNNNNNKNNEKSNNDSKSPLTRGGRRRSSPAGEEGGASLATTARTGAALAASLAAAQRSYLLNNNNKSNGNDNNALMSGGNGNNNAENVGAGVGGGSEDNTNNALSLSPSTRRRGQYLEYRGEGAEDNNNNNKQQYDKNGRNRGVRNGGAEEEGEFPTAATATSATSGGDAMSPDNKNNTTNNNNNNNTNTINISEKEGVVLRAYRNLMAPFINTNDKKNKQHQQQHYYGRGGQSQSRMLEEEYAEDTNGRNAKNKNRRRREDEEEEESISGNADNETNEALSHADDLFSRDVKKARRRRLIKDTTRIHRMRNPDGDFVGDGDGEDALSLLLASPSSPFSSATAAAFDVPPLLTMKDLSNSKLTRREKKELIETNANRFLCAVRSVRVNDMAAKARARREYARARIAADPPADVLVGEHVQSYFSIDALQMGEEGVDGNGNNAPSSFLSLLNKDDFLLYFSHQPNSGDGGTSSLPAVAQLALTGGSKIDTGMSKNKLKRLLEYKKKMLIEAEEGASEEMLLLEGRGEKKENNAAQTGSWFITQRAIDEGAPSSNNNNNQTANNNGGGTLPVRREIASAPLMSGQEHPFSSPSTKGTKRNEDTGGNTSSSYSPLSSPMALGSSSALPQQYSPHPPGGPTSREITGVHRLSRSAKTQWHPRYDPHAWMAAMVPSSSLALNLSASSSASGPYPYSPSSPKKQPNSSVDDGGILNNNNNEGRNGGHRNESCGTHTTMPTQRGRGVELPSSSNKSIITKAEEVEGRGGGPPLQLSVTSTKFPARSAKEEAVWLEWHEVHNRLIAKKGGSGGGVNETLNDVNNENNNNDHGNVVQSTTKTAAVTASTSGSGVVLGGGGWKSNAKPFLPPIRSMKLDPDLETQEKFLRQQQQRR